ncbi:hypothetical protein QQ008_29015 [Fulvivirgaceae bacterium BMA10]|uniref:Nuclear transport factor 2 family protein n=1 Tax=Splendidivirga corallicola TaxID=3051826 RepID=A0ABT8KXF8_9BACT|nr:hypothetical protein [Fulvivirgaceae bacterium BMA10]
MKPILIGLFVLLSFSLSAQQKMTADTTAVHSIDGIVKEMLRIISGEEGKTRDWDAFRNLFLPTANFTVHSHNESSGQPVETVSLEGLIELMHDTYYDQGFLEYEISKVVDEYNGIAHVFQTYYGKDIENHEEKGINSYQLVHYDDRWWIVNVLWTGDSNGVEVPEKYLGN